MREARKRVYPHSRLLNPPPPPFQIAGIVLSQILISQIRDEITSVL